YFTIKPCDRDPESGRNFTWERNYDVIQLEKNKKGYFLIISNGGMSAAEEILIARRRDCNEKTYQRRKTFLGMVTPGTETDETFRGQNLIGDIAQNIIESMTYFATPFLNKKRSETVETFIAKLRRYKIEFNDDGTGKPAHGMRSDEKEMFRCLDLSSEIIEQYMRTITWGETPSMILNETEFKKKQEEDKQKEKEAQKAQRAAEKAEKARADKEEREKRKAEKKAQREAEKAEKARADKEEREKRKAEKRIQREAEKRELDTEESGKEKKQSEPNKDNQTENR
ncbi:MAG: hypothetical protein IJ242_13535, partial [Clostridia bacterium]|nr:hypothetical protein [Clostridia bacterium]